ncbi:SDR family NAD(P)-dependent oxidoreductase [Spirosoma soli]|uniref:SDR family NAD(P)-dependent oxidoreductase n=1 Tax=Spirosoma soli TaxID=1770529 RepID=A0ABW5M6F9_9BACT
MSSNIISVIGCGWLGFPLAIRLLKEGYIVKGSATSAEKTLTLKQNGIDAYELRLNPKPEGNLTSLLEVDVLVINIPPKAGKMGNDFHPEQISYLTEPIRQSSIKHVIYVSSTSVYPELNRIVVEDDVTSSKQSAAPALTEAEQLIQGLATVQKVTVLRCGGLMGYDRIPGKYVAGRSLDTGNVPVNYLHQDDAVAILLTLIEQHKQGTFNAVAPEHPTREAVYRKSCVDFGYGLPSFIAPSEPVPYKVISPQKLIESTQYTFVYPDPLQFYYEL